MAWQLLVSGFWYARWARQGAAGLAAAPPLSALLPQVRRLPCAAVRRALQMVQRLKGWDPTELTFDLLVITVSRARTNALVQALPAQSNGPTAQLEGAGCGMVPWSCVETMQTLEHQTLPGCAGCLALRPVAHCGYLPAGHGWRI